ncbi:MAG: hypothetical protein GY696_11320, partial [Gammaproteobacteria bacterium]|nr:hypothetical protein [Gammaproteobacteria bacterium]
AVVWAMEKYHFYLYGRKFKIRTDHSCLTTLLKKGSKGMAPRRITRWYERLCKYDFEVTYRPGSQNPVADCLSRLPLGDDNPFEPKEEEKLIASIRTLEEEAALSRGEIKKATSEDEELKSVMKFVKHGWPKNNKIPTQMMPYRQIQNELFIVDGCLLRTEDRFIIPKSLIQRVIKLAHERSRELENTIGGLS